MLADALGPRRAAALLLVLGVALVASVAWPLATYTLTLGLFGVAHVMAELRYVDVRFSPRLGRSLRTGLLLALGGIAAARLAGLSGLVTVSTAVVIELALAAALVGLVAPTLIRSGRRALVVAVPVVAALATAIVMSPVAGLLVVAILHNFTPWGFVLEAADSTQRRSVWRIGTVVFVGLPVLILSGWVWAWIAPLGIASPEFTPLGYGPLSAAMRTYVPAMLQDPALKLHVFSACVFLQCVHYIAVLAVLPRLAPGREGTIRWPGPRAWAVCLLVTVLLVVAFASDFTDARRGYGVLAAVHAWLEVPILLLALAGLERAPR